MTRGSTLLTCVVCIIILLAGCGGKKTANEVAALKVGEAITVTEPVIISELAKVPEAFVGKTVRLEGIVSGVCKGSGCWTEVQAEDGSTFIARSLDHSLLVPTDCTGRKIVVQGEVIAIPPPEEEHDHEHEEGEKDHYCPRPNYLVSTQGIELY